MNCDCISVFNTKFIEQTGDPLAGIALGVIIKDNKAIGVPIIDALYRTKKNNVEYSKTQKTTHVVPKYCPFCGVKIID